MKKIILLVCLTIPFLSEAQVRVYQTFKDTWVINSPSVETTPARKLDVRITHRFGDMAGDQGGWDNFYGLEEATDVLVGLSYGVNDRLALGFYRTKGSSFLRQLLHLDGKYRILIQSEDDAMPVSLSITALGTATTMASAAPDEVSLANFGNLSHRLSYHTQALVARKFGPRFSLQAGVGYLHRNQVAFDDENSIIHISGAFRVQFSKMFALIGDIAYPFTEPGGASVDYQVPLGVGLEIETGGHVFQVNFTNARGIRETDYIPFTQSNWGDGEFRLGFTISRLFNI